MENFKGFWHSAMLNYLGQVWKIIDEYNKNFNSSDHLVYPSDRIDRLLFNIENYEAIKSVCDVTELIFKFISTTMGEYIFDNMQSREFTTPNCMDLLKDYINNYEQERRNKNGTK